MSGSSPLDPEPRPLHLPSTPLSGKIFLLLAAAGSSSRFGGPKKELVPLDGKSVLQHSLEAFLFIGDLAGIVVTCPEGRIDEIRKSIRAELLASLERRLPCGLGFAAGGASRQISVTRGLDELVSMAKNAKMDPDQSIVLIHDAARPWVTGDIIGNVISSAKANAACIPLCDLPDTPKMISEEGFIAGHPERDLVKAAQTPQGFALGPLAAAHAAAARDEWLCTDDSSLWSRYLGPVTFVPGDRTNRKITYREDIASGDNIRCGEFRIGEGWDIHPLVAGRKLLLGGIHIEHDLGEDGHSDGDVLWHAITDALLGAAGLGDIGTYFPPSDDRWKDADSGGLARMAADMIAETGWSIGNIDSTVILERPRLGPYREAICVSIAERLGISREAVSIKAKTYEGFGEVGSGKAVEARAIALLRRTK